MHRDRSSGARSLARVLFLGLLLIPAAGSAQEREVVFNQVTVSGQEAAITMEFADGGTLTAAFREGRVLLDGEEVGRYTRGDRLEAAWRQVLGQAVAADNGQVGRLLREWRPPAELEGDAQRAAEALHRRLATALEAVEEAPGAPGAPALSPEGERELLQTLVLRPERLRELTAALLEGAHRDVTVRLGESVEVGPDDVIEGTLLVLDGEVTLDGRVDGDLILLGGRVTLGDDARVTGDLRWAGAEILGNEDAVRGRIREIAPVAGVSEADFRDEIRREVREATRAAAQARTTQRPGRAAPLRNLGRGIAGLFQTALTFVILLGAALVALYFFPRNFVVVARTARNATAQSALVGLAGSVLAFPVWILGIVLLAVSIIGIPVMLLWVPAFPLALGLAVLFGYLAVASNLGRWISGREFQGLEGFDTSRPAVQIGAGLLVLLGVFAVAHVLRIGGGWLGILHTLLTVTGVMLTVVAGLVGLGAVLLSRAGRDPAYAGTLWAAGEGSDPFGPEPDPFEPEPAAGQNYTGAPDEDRG
jgi:hypothetical protein